MGTCGDDDLLFSDGGVVTFFGIDLKCSAVKGIYFLSLFSILVGMDIGNAFADRKVAISGRVLVYRILVLLKGALLS